MRRPGPTKRFKNIGVGVLTVGFGGRTKMEAFHPAVDLANNIGAPIPATADGVVTKVVTGKPQGSNDFGNTIELKDAEGNTHQFHHLHKIGVKPGQQVKKGQQIATLGNSGATYSESGKGDGAHLDLRIINAYGKYINPMPYLNNL